MTKAEKHINNMRNTIKKRQVKAHKEQEIINWMKGALGMAEFENDPKLRGTLRKNNGLGPDYKPVAA